jgi:hypothetical protein
MMERFAAMSEQQKIRGGAVLLLTGVAIIALLTFSDITSQSFRVLLGAVGVVTVVLGVLSVGTSQKTV